MPFVRRTCRSIDFIEAAAEDYVPSPARSGIDRRSTPSAEHTPIDTQAVRESNPYIQPLDGHTTWRPEPQSDTAR